ncbi:hypothetical protein F5Y13DRAFT_191957 [Hypoxylon sp. FL1857]|nr:hypothetical protein F5Y13DRAFT_191957 [Hypoxylon sp. FL1857]
MGDSQISTWQPGQGRAFTMFGDLPKELRNMIWDFAIRDARPGVHFFFLTRSWDDSVDLQKQWTTFGVSQDNDSYRYFAPRFYSATTAGASWTTHNPSTYLIDSG